MTTHVLHGIHTASGDTAVPRLFPFLEPPAVCFADYGWIAAIESRRINPVVAGTLCPYIQPEDILIGHSNGCAIIYELLQSGVKAKGIVFINGALRTDFVLPKCVAFCHVYWNAGDDVTILAMAGAEDGLVDPEWGELGHEGYSGTDPRVLNVDCGNTPNMIAVDGHSDIFTPAKIAVWGPFIATKIKESSNGTVT